MMNLLAKHRKLIVVIVGIVIYALQSLFPVNDTVNGVLNVIIPLLTALGVYQASNNPIES